MRVVFATQRYWPAVSPTIASLDELARALGNLGLKVSVLTGQWESHWPLELQVRDVSVIRFPVQGWSLLNRANLGTRIAQWLVENSRDWDRLVVVGNIEGGEEIFRSANSLNKALAIQLFETGPSTLFEDHETQVKHRRQFSKWCEQKNWITIDPVSATIIERLNPEAKPQVWNLGMDPWPAPSDRERKERRLALVDTHPVLRGSRYLPLIVYDGPYDDDESTLWLWRMLQQLCANGRNFRVWLTGDGAGLPRFYHSIVADGLEDIILLPGYFPSKEDLYSTADLVIMPQTSRLNCFDLLTCISVETPVLLSQPIAHRFAHLLDSQLVGIPNVGKTWVQQIRSHLDRPETLQVAVCSLKSKLTQTYSLSNTVEHYLNLLNSMENI